MKHEVSWYSESIILIGLFFAAFLLRIIYVYQLLNSPFFIPTLNNLDPYYYYSWALSICEGNVMGDNAFHAMPLYPYLLSLIFFISHASIYLAKILQSVIGSFSIVLMYLLAKELFNKKVALIAGDVGCMYGMFIFYEGFLLSTSLEVFMYLMFLLLLLRGEHTKNRKLWFVVGIVAGLCSLTRASILLFCVLLIAIKSIHSCKEKRMSQVREIIYFIIGMVVIVAPVSIRNYIVSGDFVLITAHGGINFYIGNNPNAYGTFATPASIISNSQNIIEGARVLAEKALGSVLTNAEVSRFWYQKSFNFIINDPLQWLSLLMRKIILFFNGHEIPDVASYEFYKRCLPLLRLPWLSFHLISPLAIGGMIVGFKQRKKMWYLYLFVCTYIFSFMLYFVNSRYRMPIIPVFIIFASYCLYMLFRVIAERNIKKILLMTCLLVFLYEILNIPLTHYDMSVAYNNLALRYKQKNWPKRAEQMFEKALQVNPNNAIIYLNYGNLFLDNQNSQKAIELYQKGISINSRLAILYEQLGFAYFQQQIYEQARIAWEQALLLNPNNNRIKANLKTIKHHLSDNLPVE